jgi:hypothetical protein
MNKNNSSYSAKRLRNLAGILLIAGGVILYLDTRWHTGWLTLLVPAAIGLTFLVEGLSTRRMILIIPGSILSALGIGLFIASSTLFGIPVTTRVGALLVAFALGWLVLIPFSMRLGTTPNSGVGTTPNSGDGTTLHPGAGASAEPGGVRTPFFWALVPGGVIGALGACFLFTPLRVLDFVLYTSVGLGFALLAWGFFAHLLGLVIPACLIVTIGPGVYWAWINAGAAQTQEPAFALTQTGTMLVWFALGWILITVLSRFIFEKFYWWPLIPGGILGMVGWGLYIGGNPSNAATFIGNTGSIILVIFGLYLLLLRKGIQR